MKLISNGIFDGVKFYILEDGSSIIIEKSWSHNLNYDETEAFIYYETPFTKLHWSL